MKQLLIYPLNIAIVMLFALFLSLFDLSSFFKQPSIAQISIVIFISLIYVLQFFLIKKTVFFNIEYGLESNLFKKYLFFGFFGFLLEFLFFGIPLLSSMGRDNYGGIPILHVVFYSCIFVSVIFASLYSNKKDLFLCVFLVLILSILLLSRQMMMVSFLIIMISSILRYDISKKTWIKILISLILVVFLFSLVGNYRQKISGDYIEKYIIVIGGANKNGESLGEVLYWIWLYITSPMYNFIVNIDSYSQFGERCNTSVYYGSCFGDYISAVLLPDTAVKYLGIDKFIIDLQVPHLNVGTGFASSARILGISGVLLQVILQGFFYIIGYKLMLKKYRNAYIVYFSAISTFMIFDNLFIRAEFFFVFILLFLARYRFIIK